MQPEVSKKEMKTAGQWQQKLGWEPVLLFSTLTSGPTK